MHVLGEGAEKPEIVMRGIAESRALGRRMHVRNVRADGEMHGDRDASLVSRGKDTGFGMFGCDDAAVQELTRCLAVANSNTLRQLGDIVEILAGFLGHAELAFAERRLNVLGSIPGKRNLEIVDQPRAVHGNSGNEAAIHQVD